MVDFIQHRMVDFIQHRMRQLIHCTTTLMQRNCETWKQSIVFGEIIFSLVPFILSLPVDMYVKLAGAGAAARRARALASCVVSSDCHASYDIWLRVFTPTDCHASYGMASYVAPMFISSN
jgi:hypothetical protein